jgi:hypothetical protein
MCHICCNLYKSHVSWFNVKLKCPSFPMTRTLFRQFVLQRSCKNWKLNIQFSQQGSINSLLILWFLRLKPNSFAAYGLMGVTPGNVVEIYERFEDLLHLLWRWKMKVNPKRPHGDTSQKTLLSTPTVIRMSNFKSAICLCISCKFITRLTTCRHAPNVITLKITTRWTALHWFKHSTHRKTFKTEIQSWMRPISYITWLL